MSIARRLIYVGVQVIKNILATFIKRNYMGVCIGKREAEERRLKKIAAKEKSHSLPGNRRWVAFLFIEEGKERSCGNEDQSSTTPLIPITSIYRIEAVAAHQFIYSSLRTQSRCASLIVAFRCAPYAG